MPILQPESISSNFVLPKPTVIETTLFDLIDAMQIGVEVGDEHLITDSISHILQSGRVTLCGNPGWWTEFLSEST